jgi:putative transposase
MKGMADTMGIARSNLIERVNRPARVRGRYRKDDDEALAVLIHRLVDERPNYGYRRITALVNRQRRAEGKPRINAKRVRRIDHSAALGFRLRSRATAFQQGTERPSL